MRRLAGLLLLLALLVPTAAQAEDTATRHTYVPMVDTGYSVDGVYLLNCAPGQTAQVTWAVWTIRDGVMAIIWVFQDPDGRTTRRPYHVIIHRPGGAVIDATNHIEAGLDASWRVHSVSWAVSAGAAARVTAAECF